MLVYSYILDLKSLLENLVVCAKRVLNKCCNNKNNQKRFKHTSYISNGIRKITR